MAGFHGGGMTVGGTGMKVSLCTAHAVGAGKMPGICTTI
jgi:hypothetical protein